MTHRTEPSKPLGHPRGTGEPDARRARIRPCGRHFAVNRPYTARLFSGSAMTRGSRTVSEIAARYAERASPSKGNRIRHAGQNTSVCQFPLGPPILELLVIPGDR